MSIVPTIIQQKMDTNISGNLTGLVSNDTNEHRILTLYPTHPIYLFKPTDYGVIIFVTYKLRLYVWLSIVKELTIDLPHIILGLTTEGLFSSTWHWLASGLKLFVGLHLGMQTYVSLYLMFHYLLRLCSIYHQPSATSNISPTTFSVTYGKMISCSLIWSPTI